MQALGTADLFTESLPSISHAIVDVRLTLADNDLKAGFNERNVSMIVDTQAWRYSDPESWNTKWITFPHAPSSPFTPSREWVHKYVMGDLTTQMSMGGSCAMLPGWFAALEDIELAIDVATWTLEAFEQFQRRGVLMPVIAWLPVTAKFREASLAAAKVYVESRAVQGFYAQLNNVNGLRDPLDRFQRSAKLLIEIQNLGLPVIAGHFGPVGLVMRAIGIAAVDCGPCDAQSFNFANSIKAAALLRSPTRSTSKRFASAIRIWVSEVGQTVTANQMAAIRRDRAAYAEIVCRRPCHRFRLGPDTLTVAVHHSLLCLNEEARQQSDLPTSVRVDAARRALVAMKSRVPLLDLALSQEQERTLRQDHLDVQLALLAEVSNWCGLE
jgi:hypothetical protein